jgi:pimeloyl-ACP methyl ester carboxylesterase
LLKVLCPQINKWYIFGAWTGLQVAGRHRRSFLTGKEGDIVIEVIGFVLAIVIALALVIIILPRVTSRETLSYEEAVQKHAPGKFVTVDGKKIHYIERGHGDPVILIHGFLYSTLMWKKSMDAFASKFRTYAVDLWGWGYSERLNATDYSFPLYAQQILKFMDALNIPKASLVGQSMGGGTSIYLAAHYPERVNKLVLVDPAAIPYPVTTIGRIYQQPFIGEFLNALPGDALIENNIKTIWFYDRNKVSREYLQEVVQPLRIRGTSEGLMCILRSMLKPPYVEDEVNMLAQTNKSILIVHGREDKAVPLDRSEKLHRLWQGSKLVVFEKAGHSPHEEHPEEFNRIAIDFLSE